MEPTGEPSPITSEATTPATTAELPELRAWEFDWELIQQALGPYESSLWWLLIVVLAVLILGTQLLLFPLFYRGIKFQAVTSMRLAYLFALLVATLVVHWWLWHWVFVLLLKSYWMWLAWSLFALLWFGALFWIPKRRLEA